MPLALLLLGCLTEGTTYAPRCDVDLVSVEPETVSVGEQVTLTGTPLTTDFDTAAYIDGERATVISLTREGCDDCDTCREDAACNDCEDCDTCDAACAAECLETLVVEIPSLSDGPAAIRIYNSHGESNALSLTIETTVVTPPATGGTTTGGTSGTTGGTSGTTTGGTTSGGSTGTGGTSTGGTP